MKKYDLLIWPVLLLITIVLVVFVVPRLDLSSTIILSYTNVFICAIICITILGIASIIAKAIKQKYVHEEEILSTVKRLVNVEDELKRLETKLIKEEKTSEEEKTNNNEDQDENPDPLEIILEAIEKTQIRDPNKNIIRSEPQLVETLNDYLKKSLDQNK